jgi:hypothetical protein
LPLVARSADHAYLESNSYRSLLLDAGDSCGFEPGRPRHFLPRDLSFRLSACYAWRLGMVEVRSRLSGSICGAHCG